ncbi:MAG: hypothetical protein ABFD75_01250 [Smithella sp.]
MSYSLSLGGLAGGNLFTAGVLKAINDNNIEKPISITAVSGAIIVTRAYAEGNLAEFIKKFGLTRPDTDLGKILMLMQLSMKRGIVLPSVPTTIDFVSDGLVKTLTETMLPVKLMNFLHTDEDHKKTAETLNNMHIPFATNAYDPITGIEYVYCNPLFKVGKNTDTRKYVPLTTDGIKRALWLSHYGYEGATAIDGAYVRQVMISEHTEFKPDKIIIATPQCLSRKAFPKNAFEQKDFETEMWMNCSIREQLAGIDLINNQIKHGILKTSKYKHINILKINAETDQGFFDYFLDYIDYVTQGESAMKGIDID